nr:acyloxyacyl hydrolase [Variovorax paradoxus]
MTTIRSWAPSRAGAIVSTGALRRGSPRRHDDERPLPGAGPQLQRTRFQFTEQLGIGRNFGAQGEHELSLRLRHFSNAGIRKPNPGENFVRVRYLYRF